VAVEPEALLDVAGGALSERKELRFSPNTERVEAIVQLTYGQIVLEESRRPAEPSAEASRLLAAAARAAGWTTLFEGASLQDLKARAILLRQAFGDEAAPSFDDDALGAALEAACRERTSFAELRAAGLEGLFANVVDAGFWQKLRTETPERVRLPGGREVRVNYETDRPPWIESRLQDFFGMKTGPTVCRGRVPIVLHLCAPNGRAVQVTRDLASFWREHYPSLRRELGRRYPRHPWPEDGATATPPTPKPPRPR
jgi:ATP-dependent helicase HrpB